MVAADIRITPADLISDDPEWVTILAWQGGLANDRGLVIDQLERLGPGHYRSTRPIPVWGIVEDADAGAGRHDHGRRADLPAGRPRHRRGRSCPRRRP